MNYKTEYTSLDDLLNATYKDIISNGTTIPSKRGYNLEVLNYSATLLNPRARTSMSLDRKLVKSKFAEFAWYLSKEESLDFIKPYIAAYNKEEKENDKILGAYGPKIFSSSKKGKKSQFERVINQIIKRPSTKQAYISLSYPSDYKFRDEKFSSPPCTIGLHFYVRNEKLNLTTYMRSNDAYFGLPHDLFCFTMLQELIACRTGIEPGKYTHISTSMHIYEDKLSKVNQYLEEGFHEAVVMPQMKTCNTNFLKIVANEFGGIESSDTSQLDPYWKDYVLFANKNHTANIGENDQWLKRFNNEQMKKIGLNSITI